MEQNTGVETYRQMPGTLKIVSSPCLSETAAPQASFTYLLWLDPSVKDAERLQLLLVPTQSEQQVDPLCREVLQQPITDVRGQQTPLVRDSSLGIVRPGRWLPTK